MFLVCLAALATAGEPDPAAVEAFFRDRLLVESRSLTTHTWTPAPQVYGAEPAVPTIGVPVTSTSHSFTVRDGAGTTLNVGEFIDRVGTEDGQARAAERLRQRKQKHGGLVAGFAVLGAVIGGSIAGAAVVLEAPPVAILGAGVGLSLPVSAALSGRAPSDPGVQSVPSVYSENEARALTEAHNRALLLEHGLDAEDIADITAATE